MLVSIDFFQQKDHSIATVYFMHRKINPERCFISYLARLLGKGKHIRFKSETKNHINNYCIYFKRLGMLST